MTEKTFTRKAAKFLTNLFSPPFISFFAFLFAFIMEGYWSVLAFLTALVFTTLVPLGYVLHLMGKGKVTDLHVTKRSERLRPIALTTFGAFIGFIILHFLQAPTSIQLLMFLYFTGSAFLMAITSFWKISLHTYSITSTTFSLSALFGFASVGFYAVLLAVVWARKYLKAHTWAQLIGGALTGFIVTAWQFAWLLPELGLL